ncbi:hypothetical protein HAX54_017310, partial [Datura stramonium]|nr:hypothetical protein [Datura stramonium]
TVNVVDFTGRVLAQIIQYIWVPESCSTCFRLGSCKPSTSSPTEETKELTPQPKVKVVSKKKIWQKKPKEVQDKIVPKLGKDIDTQTVCKLPHKMIN